jgi:hypothetical protein
MYSSPLTLQWGDKKNARIYLFEKPTGESNILFVYTTSAFEQVALIDKNGDGHADIRQSIHADPTDTEYDTLFTSPDAITRQPEARDDIDFIGVQRVVERAKDPTVDSKPRYFIPARAIMQEPQQIARTSRGTVFTITLRNEQNEASITYESGRETRDGTIDRVVMHLTDNRGDGVKRMMLVDDRADGTLDYAMDAKGKDHDEATTSLNKAVVWKDPSKHEEYQEFYALFLSTLRDQANGK